MCDADDCSMFYFLLLCSISPSTYLCQFTIWSHVLGIHLSMCLIARQQAWLSMLSVRYVPFPYLSGKFVTKCDLSSPLCIVVWLCLMLYRLVTLVIFFFSSTDMLWCAATRMGDDNVFYFLHEGLHSISCVWGAWNTSAKFWASSWRLYIVSHDSYSNCFEMVISLSVEVKSMFLYEGRYPSLYHQYSHWFRHSDPKCNVAKSCSSEKSTILLYKLSFYFISLLNVYARQPLTFR